MDTSFVKISSVVDKMFTRKQIFTQSQSPIEEKLISALHRFGVEIITQYPIGKYFADIYIPDSNLVVECDGAEFHQDKERDNARDEFMKSKGYSVIRFSGSDIHQDALDCASVIIGYLHGSYPLHEDYLQTENTRRIEEIENTAYCELCGHDYQKNTYCKNCIS